MTSEHLSIPVGGRIRGMTMVRIGLLLFGFFARFARIEYQVGSGGWREVPATIHVEVSVRPDESVAVKARSAAS